MTGLQQHRQRASLAEKDGKGTTGNNSTQLWTGEIDHNNSESMQSTMHAKL